MEENCAGNESIYRRQLTISLCEKDLRNMCGRYHFGDAGLPLLKTVYEAGFKECRPSLFFRLNYMDTGTAVLITLGEGVDTIQNRYMEEGKLSEAYAMECLSMEVLNKAYLRTEEILLEVCGLWRTAYRFPGSGLPLAMAAKIADAFGQKEVTYNGAYALIPKKSVAFIMEVQKEKPKAAGENILCSGCGNEKCAYRAGMHIRKENAERSGINRCRQG